MENGGNKKGNVDFTVYAKHKYRDTCTPLHSQPIQLQTHYLKTWKFGCFENLFCAVWVVMILWMQMQAEAVQRPTGEH